MVNLGTVIQDVMLGEEIAGQLIADDASLRAGQPAAATVPLSLYGHQGNLTILWNPNGSGLQPSQVAQAGAVAQPTTQQIPIGKASGVPIQIGNSSNGITTDSRLQTQGQ